MRPLFILILATLAIASSGAGAQQQPARSSTPVLQGWRSASWGMTPEQVVAAFNGEVKRLAKPDEYGRDRKLVAPIGIDDFDLAGTLVRVRFLFPRDSMRLVEVHLSKFEDKDFVPSRSDYSRLAQLLSEKYGASSFQDSETNKATTSWAFPETVIELSYLHIRGILQTTILRFRSVDQKARSVY